MDLHLAGALATGLGFLVTLRRLLSTGRTGRLGALILGLFLVGPGLLAMQRGPVPASGDSTAQSGIVTVEHSPAQAGSPATSVVEGQACSLHRPEKGACGLPFPGPAGGEHPPRLSN